MKMKFLLQLAHEHLDFRLPEIKSIARIFGVNLNIPSDYSNDYPYLVVDLPDEDVARKIIGRSVLVKSSMEVWAQGDSYSSLFDKLTTLPASFSSKYLEKDKSFRIKVETFNRQLSQVEKVKRIELLSESPLKFEGRVDLNDSCDVTFQLMEHYGRQGGCSSTTPSQIYFGRWISNGQREEIKKYNLSERKFIGNTSMDPTLSMIIANMAKVNSNSLVYDPFVGTGSLLVSCAHYGAKVMGSDLDYNLICGYGKSSRAGQKWRSTEESIKNNLKEYGLQESYVDVLVADASLHKMWRPTILFDAIVTDPPYGIREPTEKLGFRKPPPPNYEIPPELKENHIPCKKSYGLNDIICDLLRFAARHLSIGGRLVFWMPVCRESYSDLNVPRHRCLEIISNCEQVLNKRVSRRLITMEKTRHDMDEDFEIRDGVNGMILHDDHYKKASFRDVYFKNINKH